MILLCLCKGSSGILGDSEIEGHETWIACESVEVEVAREHQDAGNAKTRTSDVFTTVPEVWEIDVTKTVDESSPDLMKYAASGQKVVDLGKIHYLESGDSKTLLYMEVLLDSPVISKWTLTGDGDSRPTESLTIRYEKISVKYWSYDGKQRKGYGPRGWARKELKEWTGSHES